MRLKANAKINLTLDITGIAKNGYHYLDSVFQSISICDILEIEKAEELSVVFDNSDVCANESIAYKSATLFFEHTKIEKRAKIKIENHIPLGSGMGGGSSDAAAVLVGLNALFKTDLPIEKLCEIGFKIGADVPFCIIGGTARVKGFGEIVEPIKSIPKTDIIVIKDKLKSSTKDMYEKLDKIDNCSYSTQKLVNAVESSNKEEIFSNVSNCFNAVCDTKEEREILIKNGALSVGLSGSGPSVFGIFKDRQAAKSAYETIKKDHNAFLCQTENFGVISE